MPNSLVLSSFIQIFTVLLKSSLAFRSNYLLFTNVAATNLEMISKLFVNA